MKTQHIGILHPGAMGISIAASAQNSGHQVYWASEGRGSATQERAAKFGLRDVRTLAALCAECPILISVCPPHAAVDESVLALRTLWQTNGATLCRCECDLSGANNPNRSSHGGCGD